jgi:DNA-binding NarL/FixJ family response regulator
MSDFNHPLPIRVMSVDDHPMLREGIAALIATKSDMTMVAEAATGSEAIEKYSLRKPDVTLMDIQLPDMSGIDAMTAIRRLDPSAKIIVLTTYTGDFLAMRALKAGARAYALKGLVRTELAETIRAVHAGQQRICAEVAMQLANHATAEELSEREVQVLKLVASGKPNKSVARQLAIAEGTVKTHVKNILAKLEATDRTHAVWIGLDRGILGVD